MANFGNQVQFGGYQTIRIQIPKDYRLYLKSGKNVHVKYWKMVHTTMLQEALVAERRWRRRG